MDPRHPVVIGVIDTHLGFLHRDFRQPSDLKSTRVRAYWDQGTEVHDKSSYWARPAKFAYGRELHTAAINDLLAEIAGGAINEQQAYARLDHPAPEWSHAHHVASLAAGWPDPLDAALDLEPHADPAGESSLVVVQVPDDAFLDTDGNWLNCCVLDGLHYILDCSPADAAIVVTISMGAFSGPHDGSGPLTQALDKLIERHAPRLTVVVAAGNGARADAHACVTLRPARSASLGMWMDANDPTPNFIEAWIGRDQNDQAASVSFRLIPPDQRNSNGLRPGQTRQQTALLERGQDGELQSTAMLSISAIDGSPNGHGTQVLAGVAACEPDFTGAARPAPRAQPGLWTLHVERDPDGPNEPVTMHVWLARDDVPARQQRTKSFYPVGASNHVSPEGTLSDLACAKHVIVVGGYVWQPGRPGQAQQWWMDPDSSHGFAPLAHGQKQGPDVCAPSALSDFGALFGVGAVSYHSDSLNAESRAGRGTSMSAPVVARRLAGVIAQQGPMQREALLAKLREIGGELPIPPDAPSTQRGQWWLRVGTG